MRLYIKHIHKNYKKKKKKNLGTSGSIILATWETEIRRTAVQGQPGMGTACLSCQATGEAEIKRILVLGQPEHKKKFVRPIPMGKSWAWWHVPVIPKVRPYLQNNLSKKGWGLGSSSKFHV
jgi:hypothetical protein